MGAKNLSHLAEQVYIEARERPLHYRLHGVRFDTILKFLYKSCCQTLCTIGESPRLRSRVPSACAEACRQQQHQRLRRSTARR